MNESDGFRSLGLKIVVVVVAVAFVVGFALAKLFG